MTPDEKCASEKPSDVGAVRALIAYTTTPAEAQLDADTYYVRLDGQLVGTGAEIAAVNLQSGIWQRADGSYQDGRAWTGQTTLTTVGNATSTCNNWGSTASADGRVGWQSSASQLFWSFTTQTCGSTSPRLYCVEQ